MSTSYNAQIGGGKYALQFETDNQRLFKFIESAVRVAIDADVSGKKKECVTEFGTLEAFVGKSTTDATKQFDCSVINECNCGEV